MILAGIDIETTGLEQEKGHRIIEVAAALYDTSDERLLGKFVQRINPQRSIDPGALAVHGITFDMVSDCPVWDTVAPKLVKVLSRCDVVVAHNGNGFDLPFIANELVRVGQPVPEIKAIDTMLEGRWATPMGKVPSLRELCFACGVEYDTEKAHAADYDVDVMMQSFFHGLKRGFFKLPETGLPS